MSEQNKMYTWVLSYNVVCKECPNGMTSENCKLRKTLQDWQTKYGYGGSVLGFGYKKLENGNLLVPAYYYVDEHNPDKDFRLKNEIAKICDKDCHHENRKKELANPEEYKKLPRMNTIIYAYNTCGANCPAGKNHENCLLRKVIPETEQKHHIGCFKMGENTLVIPKEHYNSKTNVYYPMERIAGDICSDCFKKSR